MEDDVTLMPLQRHHNSNKDDLEINLDTIICYGAFYKPYLGNATMQQGFKTSVNMYIYRDILFEIR